MPKNHIEEAALTVCRNPTHLDQVKNILKDSLRDCWNLGESVDDIVNYWWDNHLFLKIDLEN